MAPDAIVFALANPIPEIRPEQIPDNVAIIATSRSDYPNQINNVLASPGVFKGALQVRATTIDTNMKLAAAQAIANTIPDEELDPQNIIPALLTNQLVESVANAVASAAITSGAGWRRRRDQIDDDITSSSEHEGVQHRANGVRRAIRQRGAAAAAHSSSAVEEFLLDTWRERRDDPRIADMPVGRR
jgi:malic enzyme